VPARRRYGAGGRRPAQRRAALPGVVDTRDWLVQLMAYLRPPVPDDAGGWSDRAIAGWGAATSFPAVDVSFTCRRLPPPAGTCRQKATATALPITVTSRSHVPSVSKPIWSSADHVNPTTA
jgi:hypothetical protein